MPSEASEAVKLMPSISLGAVDFPNGRLAFQPDTENVSGRVDVAIVRRTAVRGSVALCSSEIRRRTRKPVSVIREFPQAKVARLAEKPANNLGRMAMVDMRRIGFAERRIAYPAHVPVIGDHLIELGYGYAVVPPKMLGTKLFRVAIPPRSHAVPVVAIAASDPAFSVFGVAWLAIALEAVSLVRREVAGGFRRVALAAPFGHRHAHSKVPNLIARNGMALKVARGRSVLDPEFVSEERHGLFSTISAANKQETFCGKGLENG